MQIWNGYINDVGVADHHRASTYYLPSQLPWWLYSAELGGGGGGNSLKTVCCLASCRCADAQHDASK